MRRSFVKALVLCMLAVPGSKVAGASGSPGRVISLGGSVTEIIYELGQGNVLVADDLSSVYPVQATKLPRVGYYRNLPLEGMIALKPDLILASEQAGPGTVLDRVRALGIPVKVISDRPGLDSLYRRIGQIAAELGVPQQGTTLEAKLRTQIGAALESAQQQSGQSENIKAVVLMKHTHQMHGAGQGTTAAALLELAGLRNVLEQQQGYKPVSAEGLATLQPDLIITTTGSVEGLGGLEAFSKSRGINLTPAAQQNNILVMDDLLILGLGPRTGQAIQQLVNAADKARSSP